MSYKMYRICSRKVINEGTDKQKTVWPSIGTEFRRVESSVDETGSTVETEKSTIELNMFPGERYYVFEIEDKKPAF